ncbi:hypothetical protein NPA08_02305 [Mycoplasmopsis citelli]|uniref:Mbov_0399 family ICE element protein n=1 Tax=Mycoplasmopsis citelli TaxID=171281 RepID=UPI0021140BF7|nr:hypothetical protein [Mycoplasmopsis citelli]UUD35779.1 hypothetical protein NPA08_02305 [Mycoplasmopsis citelli]
MKKINKFLPLLVTPTTVFSILAVSAENKTTFDEIINRQNKPFIDKEIINARIPLFNEGIELTGTDNFILSSNTIIGFVTETSSEQVTATNYTYDTKNSTFETDYNGIASGISIEKSESHYKEINKQNINSSAFNTELLTDSLENSGLGFFINKLDSNNKTYATIHKNIDIKDFVLELKNKISDFRTRQYKENTKNQIIIESIKTSFDLDVENTRSRNHSEWFGNYSYLSKFKNIYLNIEIKLVNERIWNFDNSFIKQISELMDNFNKSKLKTLNSITIPTDVGANYGVTDYKLTSDDKSNKEHLEEELNKDPFYTKYKNFKLGGIRYEVDDSGKKLKIYFNFANPQNNKVENIILNENINLSYQNSNKYINKQLGNRLRIISGKFLDLTDHFSHQLVDDVPTRDPQDTKSLDNTWGGRWFYHTPAKVSFNTTLREDEALFINGNKIDVLDQNFEYDLNDLRQSNDNEKVANVYKIAIIKYDKANVNQSNRRELYRYETELVINSLGSDLQGKWYGWDPENNPHQKELIEPYLKNNQGEYILNSRKEKIPNPKYDPLINPKTGTKEEILWVNYTGHDKLPENTRFLQDPRNFNGEFLYFIPYAKRIGNNYGFIAAGSLVGKGVSLSSNSNIEQAQRFKINQQKGGSTFSTDNRSSIDITNNDNDYFSSTGLWLYTIRDKDNIDSYKMFYIGNVNGNQTYDKLSGLPNAKFSDVYKNTQVKPFWETYHGKNLQKFLVAQKLVSENEIKQLSYEQVINYWKQYISTTYKFYYGNENNAGNSEGRYLNSSGLKTSIPGKKFNPKSEEIKKLSANISEKDFIKIKKEKWRDLFTDYNNFPEEFKKKFDDELDFEILKNKNEIKALFSVKDPKKTPYLKLINSIVTVPVKWKEDVEFESKTNKLKITPVISKEYLDELFENASSYNDILNDIDDNLLLDFENKDKVNYSIEKTFDNKFKFIFKVKEEFYKNYFIPRDESILYYQNEKINPNYKSQYINVFSNFNLKELNLNGITNLAKAKNFIKDSIKKAFNNNFTLDKDYTIKNLDSVAQDLVDNLSTVKNPIHFDLNLVANTDKVNKLIGFKTIKVFNDVVNNNVPRESDLLKYNISEKKFNNINKLTEMYKAIVDAIDEELEIYGINFKDYLTFENAQDIYKLITPKKINTLKLKLIPLNNLLEGSKEILITNDNTTVNSSPDVVQSGKPIIKEIDYQKIAEEKLKQDQDFINSRNFPEEAEDFKNNQVKNEWEIGYVKPKGVEEIFKNLPAINGTAQIGVNKPKEQGFVEKNKSWFIPLMIISGLGVLLLLVIIYYRYLRPPIR